MLNKPDQERDNLEEKWRGDSKTTGEKVERLYIKEERKERERHPKATVLQN